MCAVINAAAQGDFSKHADLDVCDNNLPQMITSINQLLQEVDASLSETGRVLVSLSKGNLRDRMEGQNQGIFYVLESNVNSTLETLTELVNGIARQRRGSCAEIGRRPVPGQSACP